MVAATTFELTGVWPATTVPFEDDGSVSYDRFADHCRWQVASGSTGVVVNGSLGEYEALTTDERQRLVETAVEAVGADRVIPGVSDKSGDFAARWTEDAAALGVPAVMALPPTAHAPSASEVVAHFSRIAEVGVPIIAYNNPFSTRADLTPDLMARLSSEVPLVVGLKDFSQDVRRVLSTIEAAPDVQVIAGCDDILLEAVLVGARGWIAGFANAFPEQSAVLYDLALTGDLERALPLYRAMLPILRWDARPEFVQAIKISQGAAGRYGGPCRLPRTALPADVEEEIIAAARHALEIGVG